MYIYIWRRYGWNRKSGFRKIVFRGVCTAKPISRILVCDEISIFWSENQLNSMIGHRQEIIGVLFFFFLFLFGFGWANNVSFNPRGFARFCFMSNRMKWIANCKLNIVGDHLWGLAKSDHNVLFIQNSITFTYGFQSLPNQVN